MRANKVRATAAAADLPVTATHVAGHSRLLDPRVNALFGPRFGSDFSQVRVHDNAAAARLAGDVHSRAVTMGNDIAFGAGEFDPTSVPSLRTVAHELAHVVQFRRPGIGPDAERRASAAADSVVAGRTVAGGDLGARPGGPARDAAATPATPGFGDRLTLTIARFDGFATAPTALTAAQRRSLRFALDQMRTWIANRPDARFTVVGRVGVGGQNEALASRHARIILGELLAAGVSARSLDVDTADAVDDSPQVEIVATSPGSYLDRSRSPSSATSLLPAKLPVGFGAQLPPSVFPPGSRSGTHRPAEQVPEGGPSPARTASTADLIGAVSKLTFVQTFADEQARRLGQVPGGVIGVGLVEFAVPLAVGVAESPQLRQLAREFLHGKKLPLSLIADAHFELSVPLGGRTVGLDLRKLGAVPNDILRATTVEFRLWATDEQKLPAGAPDIGFVMSVDMTKLPFGTVLK